MTPPPAAPGPTKTVTPLSVDYAKSYANTVIDLVKSPSTADTGTLVVGGLVLGAIAGATALDANVKRYTQRHRNVSSNKTADVVRPFGEPMLLAGGSALAYAGGLALGDRKLQETGLLSVESLLISAGLTEGIKRAAGRQRPNQTDDQYKFDGIGGKGKSFPSGHTSHAFSVASVLAEQYDETRYVPALSYAITGLTGLSRINDNKHWLSDTMFSAALGYVVGKITVKNSVFREATGLSILPYSDGRDVGINLGMKF
ncbi:MAG: phosphatase PAP2 family protein [Alphaproteobacteria bacterium]|nr:phosphatase PAP2 family protein [Alphaproteobacteria bacterium]